MNHQGITLACGYICRFIIERIKVALLVGSGMKGTTSTFYIESSFKTICIYLFFMDP